MLIPTLLLAAAIATEPGSQPARQPHLAAAHGTVAMTFAAGRTIYYSASSDGGRTFAPPVKVVDAGAVMLGRHRGPRLAILKDVLVIAAIVADKPSTNPHAHGGAENGDLSVWRSADRGRTWHAAGIVNDVPAATREGLHTLAAAPDGALYAAWLDLRAKGTQLYGARSHDGGRTWSANFRIYASPSGTICQCCHPTLTVDERGTVWAMWRNAIDGSRDLWMSSSADGETWKPAHKLGAGTWKLEACPMDGGGLAIERGTPVSAWRREGELYLVRGDAAEQHLGSGKDVAIAATSRGIYTAWTGKQGAVAVLAPGAGGPAILAPEGGYVSLAALPDGAAVAAWESKAGVEFQRVEP